MSRKKVFLTVSDLLNPDNENSVRRLMRSYDGARENSPTKNYNGQSVKHDPVLPYETITPFIDAEYWQSCDIKAPVINATGGVRTEGLLGLVPITYGFYEKVSKPFVTGYNFTLEGTPQEDFCTPARSLSDKLSACKLALGFGRASARTKTLELDQLIREVCANRNFDNLAFIGDAYGVNPNFMPDFTPADADVISDAAMTKQLRGLGAFFSTWISKNFWEGDPTASDGVDNKPFLGLLPMLSGDYSSDMAPYLTGLNGIADCGSLSADVKKFGRCMGDGTYPSLYELINTAENTVSLRETYDGLRRENLALVMHPLLWQQFVETWLCADINYGCNSSTVLANDGGSGFAIRNERQRMLESRVMSIGGRSFRVVLDPYMPISEAQGANGWEYTGSIIGIPLSVSGVRTLELEMMDYKRTQEILSPIRSINRDSWGYTDNGRFLHTVQRTHTCFNVQTKTEPRLWFLGSRWSWRIDGVTACVVQRKPQASYPVVGV